MSPLPSACLGTLTNHPFVRLIGAYLTANRALGLVGTRPACALICPLGLEDQVDHR